jgi:hypothetical protein
MKFSSFENQDGRETKYQHSTVLGQSSCPKMMLLEQLKLNERAPAQNNNKTKPEHLKLSKTYPIKWPTTTDS